MQGSDPHNNVSCGDVYINILKLTVDINISMSSQLFLLPLFNYYKDNESDVQNNDVALV